MLTIARLGQGASAADYYLDRQAGCPEPLDYYAGEGERRGSWCGGGGRAFGVAGVLDARGEAVLRAALAGESLGGSRLVPPVLRGDPRGRVAAAPLVAAVDAALAERSPSEAGSLLGDDRLDRALTALRSAVAVDARVPRRPRATVPADVAVAVAAAAGVDAHAMYRDADGVDQLAAALAFVDARVDVRRAGLDLTFSAPKSVSVLFGLGDAAVAEQVRAAHDAAVVQVVEYLESLAARGARGHHDAAHPEVRIDTDGMIACGFEHRASRSDDPQLHTHVVVANLVRGVDGRWSALDTRELYRQALTGGYLYQAVLRGELSVRLGVRWGRVRNGVAEVDGIPVGLRRVFSSRRAAIEEHLAAHGQDGPRAAQVAALRTRPAKGAQVEETLRDSWARRAREAGVDPAALVAAVTGRVRRSTSLDVDAVAAKVLGPDGVTRRSSSFDRRALLRAVCEAVPTDVAVSVADLRAVATRLVRDPRVVPLAKATPTAQRRYSTVELLTTEAAALRAVGERADVGVAVCPAAVLAAAVGGCRLSAEQQQVVRSLTTSGAGVEVVVGPAGSGKTAALAAARAAWARCCVPVTGVATAAIAARTLADGAGIPAMSITRMLHRLDSGQSDHGYPGPGGVLVVDEAGMVGTRVLATLIELTGRTAVKLVLLGDPAQLPEIDAGGLFTALTRTVPTTRLTGNVRQVSEWERDALATVRDGDVLDALAAYSQHGRVHVGDTAAQTRAAIVGDYVDAVSVSPSSDVVMLTSRRDDARALNRLARAALIGTGLLSDSAVTVPAGDRSIELRVGERVVVTANRYPLGLLNGTRATVRAVTVDDVELAVGEQRVRVPVSELADGLLDYGYALTCHRAQGITVDVALLYASRSLTREGGYVGLSRGRVANHLYATTQVLLPDVDVEAHHPPDEPILDGERAELTTAALVQRLETSTAQTLAWMQLDGDTRDEWQQRWDEIGPVVRAR